ncbi:MAG: tetratricopeptide repeat protein, partial [Thiogranum sp.]
AQGDFEGALSYAQRALAIDEQVYGTEHPNVGTDANTIGAILKCCF